MEYDLCKFCKKTYTCEHEFANEGILACKEYEDDGIDYETLDRSIKQKYIDIRLRVKEEDYEDTVHLLNNNRLLSKVQIKHINEKIVSLRQGKIS